MQGLQNSLSEIIEKLKINVPDALSVDDPIDENNWNRITASITLLTQAVNAIKDVPSTLPSVGSPYFRLPGMKEPWEVFSATTSSQWTAIHTKYPGVFFRLAGGYASKFNEKSEQVQYDKGVQEEGGGQEDALKYHEHFYLSPRWRGMYAGRGNGGVNEYTHDSWTGDIRNTNVTSETRPKNITIELYIFKGE